MRITDEELKNIMASNVSVFSKSDLSMSLIDAREAIRILESMVKVERKYKVEAQNRIMDFEHDFLEKSNEIKRLKSDLKVRDTAVDLAKTLLTQKDEHIKSLEDSISIRIEMRANRGMI